MNHIFEWDNTFISNSPWTTYLNEVILSSVTLHFDYFFKYVVHGDLLTKVLPLLNYVDHGELLTKVLLHSIMWFVENYWRKCYPIQLCGSWRVSDESVTTFDYFFKYVVHGDLLTKVLPLGNTFVSNSPWTTYLNGVILSSVTLHEPYIWMG
jgi:hypothetical protein